MFPRVRTFFVAFFFVISLIIVIIAMFLFRRYEKQSRYIWANAQKYLIGFRMNINGHIDAQAKLFVINHQSMLDIIAMEAVTKEQNLAWIAKKEIYKVFFFNQALKLSNMISLDRSDKRAIVKLLKDVKDRLDSGRYIAIFPEGTRGRGDKLLKFQIGAKILAEKLDLTVQPVVISNARNVFDSQNFKINGGEIKISFLPSVNPKKDENWFENLHKSMQNELSVLLGKTEK